MTAYMPKHRANDAARSTHHNFLSVAPLGALVLALLIAFSSIAVVGAQESTPDATPAAEPTPSPTMPRLELDLAEMNDSGISGTVTLYDAGDQTIVEFDVEGAGGDHPAHIHEGVCGALNPEPAYSLDNVDKKGESTTVVDVKLDDLLDEDYAVDMHLSPNELGTLIACVDIDGDPEVLDGATPEASPESRPSDGTGGTVPTQLPTKTAPTQVSDGTGGAIATETPAATEVAQSRTTVPAKDKPQTAAAEPTEAVTAAPTEATTPTASIPVGQGDVGDGTGGAGSTIPAASGATTAPVSPGDGTSGVSGKGDPVSATTLPQQAGVGSALIWPESPGITMMWASTLAAVILGASAWIIRRGERSPLTTPSRWNRMGI